MSGLILTVCKLCGIELTKDNSSMFATYCDKCREVVDGRHT